MRVRCVALVVACCIWRSASLVRVLGRVGVAAGSLWSCC